jgi:predicted RNase H-like HicB family nuclease
MASNARASYAVTLERGTDGTYLAWVDDLPGCAVRGDSRGAVLERLPRAISEFLVWAGMDEDASPNVTVSEEVESAIEADEDTEVLVFADRAALTTEDWALIRTWLDRSRAELNELLAGLDDDDLARRRQGSERTIGADIEHLGFVELMYAVWTFDLRSRAGLEEFLAWSREIAVQRMERLAHEEADALTWADWGGAPRLEPWTARKAARRLVWHELLHLRALERSPARAGEAD